MGEFECNYFWCPSESNIHTENAWLPGSANHTNPRATMDSANSFAILTVVEMVFACFQTFSALKSFIPVGNEDQNENKNKNQNDKQLSGYSLYLSIL